VKRIKRNNIIVAFGLILLSLNISAQPPTDRKRTGIGLVSFPYIFEGKLISQHTYTIKSNEGQLKDYNFYLIEITKVLKGDIKKGAISIVIPFFVPKDGQLPTPPKEGLYICASEDEVKDTSSVNTNSKSLAYYCGQSMVNGEFKNDKNNSLIRYFPKITDFYTYLSNNGVNIAK
jgi:hypothetical protein